MFVIISGPSGSGKSTVISELMESLNKSTRLVTTTTRDPRPGEQEGVDYHFCSRDEFEQQLEHGDFFEHNRYSGNYYGSSRERLQRLLDTYDVVFSQIDVNGRTAVQKAGIPHVAIFLMPQDLSVLEDRLRARAGMKEEDIDRRLETARKEMARAEEYDYIVVNKEGQLPETLAELKEIISSQQSS